jgi:hypothetical protein
VPFCVYGGPVASEPAVMQTLIDHATDLMSRLGANVIEFRTLSSRVEGWTTRSDIYATFRKPCFRFRSKFQGNPPAATGIGASSIKAWSTVSL